MSKLDWFRVDDRLIHGQVMVGWVFALRIREMVLANDSLVNDSWRIDVLQGAIKAFSEEVKLTVLPVDKTASYLETEVITRPLMLLVDSLEDARKLVRSGIDASVLNLGGVHSRPGRAFFLPFLYLDSGEIEVILELSRMGIRVIAQDLPSSKAVDMLELLKKKRNL